MNYCFLMSRYFASGNTVWLKLGSGGSWEACAIPAAGYYYLSNDTGANSLLDWLLNAITDTACLWLVVSRDSAGRVLFTNNDTTTTIYVSLTDPAYPSGPYSANATAIRDAIYPGASGYTFSVAAGATVNRDETPYGDFFPSKIIVSDLTKQNYTAHQTVADSGTVRTALFHRREETPLEVRTVAAYPRAAIYNEYKQLIKFLSLAETGLAWRYYPDVDVYNNAFDIDLYPTGYHTFIADQGSCRFVPQPEHIRFDQFRHTIICYPAM